MMFSLFFSFDSLCEIKQLSIESLLQQIIITTEARATRTVTPKVDVVVVPLLPVMESVSTTVVLEQVVVRK